MRRRGLIACVLAGVLAAAGCTLPQSPTVLNPMGPLVERFRQPLPVPPDGHGTWPLLAPQVGVIGSGRMLARFSTDGHLMWKTELPPELAITSAGPGPHSAYASPDRSKVVVLGGADLAVLSLDTGAIVWRAPLPAPAPRWAASGANVDHSLVVVGGCGGAGCTLVARDEGTGAVIWTSQVPGATWVATGEEPGLAYPGVWAGAPGRRWAVNTDGKVVGTTTAPLGPLAAVLQFNYRTVLVTAPVDATCKATASGYGARPDGTPAPDPTTFDTQVWTISFRWDDPRATPDAHGCRFNPALTLRTTYHLVLPDIGGAMLVDDYNGTVTRRWAPGQYLLTDAALSTDGRHYIDDLFQGDLPVAMPNSGRPWGVDVGTGGYVVGSGDGATLTQSRGPAGWHVSGALAAMSVGEKALVFLTPTETVVVGPAATTPPH
jgi:hypothetical protein